MFMFSTVRTWLTSKKIRSAAVRSHATRQNFRPWLLQLEGRYAPSVPPPSIMAMVTVLPVPEQTVQPGQQNVVLAAFNVATNSYARFAGVWFVSTAESEGTEDLSKVSLFVQIGRKNNRTVMDNGDKLVMTVTPGQDDMASFDLAIKKYLLVGRRTELSFLVTGHIDTTPVGNRVGLEMVDINLVDLRRRPSVDFTIEGAEPTTHVINVANPNPNPNPDPNPDPNPSPGDADLALTVLAPGSVARNSQANYTIIVENRGPSTSSGGYVKFSAPVGTVFNASGSSTEFSWNGTYWVAQLGSMASQAKKFLLVGLGIPTGMPTGEMIANISVVPGNNDPVMGNNSASALTFVTAA